MPTDTRTPDEIEREIERERQELNSTVRAIQDRFSPEMIIREITRGVRDHGGEIGTAVSRSVKQNPVALALTGVGLAWLMFGRSHEDPAQHVDEQRVNGGTAGRIAARPDAHQGQNGESVGNLRSAPTRYAPAQYRAGQPNGGRNSRAGQYAAYPAWARHELDEYDDHAGTQDDDDGRTLSDRASEAGSAVAGAASSAASGARGAAAKVASGARSAGSGIASGASSAASSVADGARSVGSNASHAARVTADRAARARERLARGTEDLSEAARERVINARARAVEMARRAETAARRNYARSRDFTQDFIEEQPLVAGALAVAVGAALAGALPRTRQEDELLGATRDDLFDEAERIFQEERQKVERVAQAAVDEAGAIAQEKRDKIDAAAPGSKSAAEAAADEVRDAGERVKEAARQKAEEERLGNPKA